MRVPLDNLRSSAALSRFALVCILGLAADLYSKRVAFEHLAPAWAPATDTRPHVVPLIKNWIHFEITTNRGAVFGMGQGKTALFLAVSAMAIAFLGYLFLTSRNQRLYQVILGMLLAGVLGNMYDRIAFEYVRDMIHALPGWKWPGTWILPVLNYPPGDREVFPFIFNVADVLLCVGVGLMIIYSLFFSPEKDAKKASEPAPA